MKCHVAKCGKQADFMVKVTNVVFVMCAQCVQDLRQYPRGAQQGEGAEPLPRKK